MNGMLVDSGWAASHVPSPSIRDTTAKFPTASNRGHTQVEL